MLKTKMRKKVTINLPKKTFQVVKQRFWAKNLVSCQKWKIPHHATLPYQNLGTKIFLFEYSAVKSTLPRSKLNPSQKTTTRVCIPNEAPAKYSKAPQGWARGSGNFGPKQLSLGRFAVSTDTTSLWRATKGRTQG